MTLYMFKIVTPKKSSIAFLHHMFIAVQRYQASSQVRFQHMG